MRLLCLATCLLASLLAPVPARASLIDLGNGLIYDTVQDLTWMQDTAYAGRAGTQEMLSDAEAWAGALVFGGFDDWRLPRWFTPAGGRRGMEDTSEVARLMGGLGWTFDFAAVEYTGTFSTGPFLNFWIDGIATFWLGNGSNLVWHSTLGFDPVDDTARTWVVRDGGNPAARVPEPSTLMALAVGVGLLVARRRARSTLTPPRDQPRERSAVARHIRGCWSRKG